MAGGIRTKIVIKGIQYPPRFEDVTSGPDSPGERFVLGENAATDGGEPVVTVQEAEADYYCRDGSHYLFYEEQEGDFKPTKTRVKQKNHTVEIIRSGPIRGNMLFEVGKMYRTEYVTPYGRLLLDIVTHSVEAVPNGTPGDEQTEEISDSWPDVKICYALENEGRVIGEYELKIYKATE